MNFGLLLPEYLVTGLAFIVFGIDLFLPVSRKDVLAYISTVGLVAIIAVTLGMVGTTGSLYNGAIVVDAFSLFFKVFFLALAVFITLASIHYAHRNLRYRGEYYALILLSTLGMMLMAAARELLTAYISLELLNFSLYVLATYARENPKSNEAGLKYVLLGAFASGLLLYGISILYGLAKTTTYDGLAQYLAGTPDTSGLLLVGLALVTAGLGFKVAAVPFHMWTPDVYEGAPLPVTAYISAASKAAGFTFVLRFFAEGLLPAVDSWQPLIILIAAISMTLGNLVALQQRNIKRLLAYSSIGQVGYLLLGVAALNVVPVTGMIFHLVGYVAANLLAFVAIIAVSTQTGKEDIADFSGMSQRSPFVAMVLSMALFSLAGLPFFAGFATKFYLFATVATQNTGLLWLVSLAVVNSLISLYYYLVVVRFMYIQQAEDTLPIRVPAVTTAVLAALTVVVIAIGVYPQPLIDLAQRAASALF